MIDNPYRQEIAPRTHRPGGPSRRDAFTLLELLITIAIVAVLAALAFVVYPRVRRGAQTAASINNMRQVHLLMIDYLGDNNNEFPMTVYQRERGLPSWRRKIWENSYGTFDGSPPEVMDAMQASSYSDVMWCPMMVGEHGQDQHPEGRGSYTLNRFFMPPAWGGGIRRMGRSELIGLREPYLMTGTLYKDDKRFGTFYHLDSSKFPYDTFWSNLHYAYGAGGENALGVFIDGHAEPIPKQKGIELHDLLRDPNTLE